MEIASSFSGDFSFPLLFLALIATAFCCFFAFVSLRSSPLRKSKSDARAGAGVAAGDSFKTTTTTCNCACSCKAPGAGGNSDSATATAMATATYLNGATSGGGREMLERVPVAVAERQTGASMMEQLVPEITTHALSYLDYPSLCRLSMTNSLMRKAANDDNAWKALYHKDFTWEQDSITPVNGWKAYYAATRAILNINMEFFNIIRERSLPSMGCLWLNADYVKCVHFSAGLFTGYNAVMESWQLAFDEQGADFQIRDVRARVLTDVAWVTMKTYFDIDSLPFHVTNVFELHNGRWYMVHHHSSSAVILINGGGGQQIVQG